MKRLRFGQQVLLVFATVLVGYGLAYGWIEHRRVVKGPWVVTYASEAGMPALRVNQATLGIRDVRIVFAGERTTNHPPQTLAFSQVKPWPYEVPFGQCVFMDTTFLPGTIALEMFGHKIQLLPRLLTIDDAERPWRSGEIIELK